MKHSYALLLIMSCTLALKAGEVRLHGSAKELKRSHVELQYAGSASEISNYRSVRIPVDAEGNFDITFPLEHPAYYTTGMHVLYLSPGDDLEILFSRSPARTLFTGRGSEANSYLKGWRWDDNRHTGLSVIEKPPIEQVIEKVDSLAEERLHELATLTEADKRFQKLETARIAANRISVYFNYIYCTEYYRWDDPTEAKEEKKLAYYRTLKEKVEPLLHQIDRDEEWLECPAVREVLLECLRSKVFTFRVSKKIAHLSDIIRESTGMDAGISKASLDAYREYARHIKEIPFREAFEAKLAARVRLMEGAPAVDIALQDPSGKRAKLSDYRGKVLFIDFWATWCIPCLAQAPHVKSLSEKYNRIEFIAISIDQEEAKWRSKLERDGEKGPIKEFIANVYEVADAWDLSTIPRFVLIDAEFKIITAFAPRPSDKSAIEQLLDQYNK
ncbi:MAG: TlpA family protein disulfide reductase [Odoribacteraceae bacterium]|nr:TlpA family protein disulfide reductase [Odoribacteraceae bacterium]